MLVDRNSTRRSAFIKRAVFTRRGWRFKDQHPSVVYSKTLGGLGPDDLMENRTGQIVSKRRHEAGKRAFAQNRKAMERMKFVI